MELNEVNEIQTSEESEVETTTTTLNTSPSFLTKSAVNNKQKKKINLSSKSKRHCTFNKNWLKDPRFSSFLTECRTNPCLAHCSICKSNFSIANGGVYLVNRHAEQPSHKQLAETQAKEKC
jgi:hypothetical protein